MQNLRVKYLASLSFSTSSSVMEEGIHRPRRSEPDIVKGRRYPNLKPWVLELGARGGFDRGLKEKNGPWSHYKEEEYQEPSP